MEEMGYTHIELPRDGAPVLRILGLKAGFFAPTRFGSPSGFCRRLSPAGIGVFDWVTPRATRTPWRGSTDRPFRARGSTAGSTDWGTPIFNYGRNEVVNYLLANALFWLHDNTDGLRVDAVASMLYLDYSRNQEWIPNKYGGRENLEGSISPIHNTPRTGSRRVR
jgi:1,4-alpha-glucan branching enzyme